MACYKPIPAWQGERGGPVRLWPPLGTATLALPCGKCLGCRTEKASMWAERCRHEISQSPYNSFVTLTYDDKHLPPEGHLVKADLQRFFKRLRQRLARNRHGINSAGTHRISYFACGEYGTRTQRPHYHALLFNCAFTDQKKVGQKGDYILYESGVLSELWPFGGHRIGNATAATAGYIAQYNLKQVGAGDADPDGVWRPKPFLHMSTKPPIGAAWLQRHSGDLRKGFLTDEGRKRSIPRTYLRRLEKLAPQAHEEIQENRERHRHLALLGDGKKDRNEPARLKAAEIIHASLKKHHERDY